MVSLDNFASTVIPFQPICFIKIYVQGYEPNVMAGMRELIRTSPNLRILFEYHPNAIRSLGFEPQSIFTILRLYGFYFYLLTKNGLGQQIYSGDLDSALNHADDYVEILAKRDNCIL